MYEINSIIIILAGHPLRGWPARLRGHKGSGLWKVWTVPSPPLPSPPLPSPPLPSPPLSRTVSNYYIDVSVHHLNNWLQQTTVPKIMLSCVGSLI